MLFRSDDDKQHADHKQHIDVYKQHVDDGKQHADEDEQHANHAQHIDDDKQLKECDAVRIPPIPFASALGFLSMAQLKVVARAHGVGPSDDRAELNKGELIDVLKPLCLSMWRAWDAGGQQGEFDFMANVPSLP